MQVDYGEKLSVVLLALQNRARTVVGRGAENQQFDPGSEIPDYCRRENTRGGYNDVQEENA